MRTPSRLESLSLSAAIFCACDCSGGAVAVAEALTSSVREAVVTNLSLH